MNSKKVIVAMSGGVDSTVAAHILKEEGYEVSGLYMKVYKTISDQAEKDFISVCEHLEIPWEIVDLSETFKEHVVDYFIDAYQAGETPNPCVACNKHIKFGALLDLALERGADFLATGHYAKIIHEGGLYFIERAESGAKDQTYMFYNMTQEVLSRLLMPLGRFDSKEQVRDIARAIDAPVAEKGDSQEICFVPDDDYIAFLREEGVRTQSGDFVDKSGKTIGKHKGAVHFTIGQRKGLGMSFGKPTYVLEIDSDRNRVVLGDNDDLMSQSLTACQCNWVSLAPEEGKKYQAKIRYSARPDACTLTLLENGCYKLSFDSPQRAITPGQSVVIYDGNRLLGGGVIKK